MNRKNGALSCPATGFEVQPSPRHGRQSTAYPPIVPLRPEPSHSLHGVIAMATFYLRCTSVTDLPEPWQLGHSVPGIVPLPLPWQSLQFFSTTSWCGSFPITAPVVQARPAAGTSPGGMRGVAGAQVAAGLALAADGIDQLDRAASRAHARRPGRAAARRPVPATSWPGHFGGFPDPGLPAGCVFCPDPPRSDEPGLPLGPLPPPGFPFGFPRGDPGFGGIAPPSLYRGR